MHAQRDNLVSCLLIAPHDGRFIIQAVKYFLRQDYRDKQLLVLQQPGQDLTTQFREHSSITFTVLANTGELDYEDVLQESQGRFFAWWDAYAWYAPNRLSQQVDHLRQCRGRVSVACTTMRFKPIAARAWRCTETPLGPIARETLLCDRTADSFTAGELRSLHLTPRSYFNGRNPTDIPPGWHVSIDITSSTVPPPHTHSQPLAVAEILRLLAEDRSFYSHVRNGGDPARRAPLPSRKPVRADHHVPTLSRRGAPKVSCIMPTYNRRRYISHAIACFLQQDYDHRELIVIDDGEDAILDLLPEDSRISYVRLRPKRSIGVKRNVGVEAATGDLVMCWDDDDWFGSNRIRHQVTPILEGRADATALQTGYIFDRQTGQFWSGAGSRVGNLFQHQVNWGTMAWDRATGRSCGDVRFPDSSLAEDVAFKDAFIRKGGRVMCLGNPGVFVYVRHGANTWSFSEATALPADRWQQVPSLQFLPSDFREQFGSASSAAALTSP